MKKKLLLSALCAFATMTMNAGGFLTNTNHGAHFLRFPAMEGVITVEGALYNPAGIGFLTPGWHIAVNNQTALQTRTIQSFYEPFRYGAGNNGMSLKKFEGKSTAPIIPSFDIAYVKDRWFGSFHFGVIGGGGKCEFDNGLGSFESVVSMLPGVVNALAPMDIVSGYSAESFMRGKQYYFGGQIGLGYKVDDHLSVSLGGRLIYASCNYYGYVRNISLTTAVDMPTAAGTIPAGTTVPAANLFNAAGMGSMAGLVGDVNVNCDQSGWGFAPIIGVNYNNGRWNVGLRYEAKARLRLKNRSTTEASSMMSNLEEFQDGKKVAGDMPAFFGIGAQYKATDKFRVGLGYHYYFDDNAHQHNHKQDKLDANTWELLGGLEYDITDRLTASVGGQMTNYGLGKKKDYISDMSFTTSSYSLGAGVKVKLSEKVDLNVSYFKTFYYSTRKNQEDYNGVGAMYNGIVQRVAASGALTPEQIDKVNTTFQNVDFSGNDLFDRTNDVIGVGVNIKF